MDGPLTHLLGRRRMLRLRRDDLLLQLAHLRSVPRGELSTARVGGAVAGEWDHEPPRRCDTARFAGLYRASYI